MFAASVTELSHFGMGGEAPILIRTKAGKVFAIAGVGTMPKLATAEMFRTRPLRAGEILETLQARDGVKGEITLLIGKAEEGEARVETGALARPSVRQRVEQIMGEEQIDEKAALKKVAKERGVSKSAAYRELQRTR